MSLIAPQPKATAKDQLTVRLERPVNQLLKRYSTFIESSQDYVLNQALSFFFQKDKEFSEWLDRNPDSALPEPAKKVRKRRGENGEDTR
jgi:bacterioferritin (cytochrome b1)